MIKSTELSKKYGENTVLTIESLEIPKGLLTNMQMTSYTALQMVKSS